MSAPDAQTPNPVRDPRVVMLLSNACAPDPRVEKEAEALAAAGFVVTIVAWDRAGGLPQRDQREGYIIERIGPRAVHGGGMKNLGAYRTFWRTAAEVAVQLGADIVHCHDADTIPAGMRVLRSAPGTRLVLDFHELYRLTKMVPQRGAVGTLARAAVDRLERKAIRAASLVILANPGTEPHYRGMGAGEKLVTVDNAPDAEVFRPMECEGGSAERPFTVCFIGRMRYARTLIALMDAVDAENAMRATFAGSGPEQGVIAEAVERHENSTISGPVPYREIPEHYACCDVVYAAYDTLVGNPLVATPGKVLEAMACARPVIVSRDTFIGRWVEERGVGLAVQGDDAASVASALRKLRDEPGLAEEMGRRGRELVEHELNWDVAAGRLLAGYERIG